MTSVAPKACDRHGNFVGTNACPTCKREYNQAYYKRNRDKMIAQAAARYAAEADSINEKRRLARLAWDEEKRAAVAAAKAANYRAHIDFYAERNRAWREANPGKIKSNNAATYARNRMDPAYREYRRQYNAAHSERKSLANAAWREANDEHHRANARRWYRDNKTRVQANRAAHRAERRAGRNARQAERNARQLLTRVPYTADQLAAKWAYWGDACWMCGGVADTLDHVKPLRVDGPHMLANLRPACRSCNSSKHAKWYGPQELHRFIKN